MSQYGLLGGLGGALQDIGRDMRQNAVAERQRKQQRQEQLQDNATDRSNAMADRKELMEYKLKSQMGTGKLHPLIASRIKSLDSEIAALHKSDARTPEQEARLSQLVEERDVIQRGGEYKGESGPKDGFDQALWDSAKAEAETLENAEDSGFIPNFMEYGDKSKEQTIYDRTSGIYQQRGGMGLLSGGMEEADSKPSAQNPRKRGSTVAATSGTTPSMNHIQALLQNPDKAADYDRKFGKGAAEKILKEYGEKESKDFMDKEYRGSTMRERLVGITEPAKAVSGAAKGAVDSVKSGYRSLQEGAKEEAATQMFKYYSGRGERVPESDLLDAWPYLTSEQQQQYFSQLSPENQRRVAGVASR